MSTWLWVALAVVVVVIVAAAIWFYRQRQRSEHLREHFGPEYRRTVAATGDRKQAENELLTREHRVQELNIQPLAPAERARFADEWRQVQSQFVDDPAGAVEDADRLVARVMEARGYPMSDFEQRAADVSVDHPEVVQNYRAAHRIALASDQGAASTEDLRQAMQNYHALFDDLLAAPAGPAAARAANADRQRRRETTS